MQQAVGMIQDGLIPEPLWSEIQASVPIAGVDLLPLRTDPLLGEQVGLILRDFPEGGQRWCHVGGRQKRNETQEEAARRHLTETLMRRSGKKLAVEKLVFDSPNGFVEFLTVEREGYGYDPRKHAVSACFRVSLPEDVTHRPGGEANEFHWFPRESVPADELLWPGTRLLIDRLLTYNDELAVYESISARQAAHNSLLWQTPALAMTAQAFLMTIALGEVPVASRLVASMLGVVIAALSIQLMKKHSESERRDTRILHSIELRHGMRPAHERVSGETWLTKLRSRTVWTVGLGLFGAASLAIAFVGVFAPDLFVLQP